MSIRKILVVLITAGLVVLALPGVSSAVPILQLWSPDATYDAASESWVVQANSFELQVLGARARGPLRTIEDIWLLAAIPDTYWSDSDSPWLKISTISGKGEKAFNQLVTAELRLTKNDLYYGNPGALTASPSGQFPAHGVYPTYYWAINLDGVFKHADGTDAYLDVYLAKEAVPNHSPGATGSVAGDIQYYRIEYGSSVEGFLIQFDLVGLGNVYTKSGASSYLFAPFGHNVTAIAQIAHAPEPATLALLASGLVALGVGRIRRRRSRRPARSSRGTRT